MKTTKRRLRFVVGVVVLGVPLVALAQRPVRLPDAVESAAVMAVQVDPATRVTVARQPRPIERGSALETLGLTPEQLRTELAATYSPTRLDDDMGRLAVFYAGLVKQGDRWVFWSDELPKGVLTPRTELQVTFDAARDTRYLVDFVIDTAEQEFAVVSGEARSTQTAADGHIAVVVAGTGRPETVRVLPMGDAQTHARRLTVFQVIVTPLR